MIGNSPIPILTDLKWVIKYELVFKPVNISFEQNVRVSWGGHYEGRTLEYHGVVTLRAER